MGSFAIQGAFEWADVELVRRWHILRFLLPPLRFSSSLKGILVMLVVKGLRLKTATLSFPSGLLIGRLNHVSCFSPAGDLKAILRGVCRVLYL